MERDYKPRKIKPLDYQCRTADPHNLRFAITHMRWATCPYWIGHARYKNRLLGDLLFEKWNKRPQSAYKLYWRLHPDEYLGSKEVYKK
jgi:hypothetical protein